MTDEVQTDTAVETPAAETAIGTPAEVVETPVKADFANHSVYADFKAHIDEFGKEASARLYQLLAEARDLFNL
jgi:hypothetical protein